MLHIISGDLWAGAEVQAYTLISNLRKLAGIELGAVLMNDGELAQRLRAAGVWLSILDERRLSTYRIFAGLKAVMREWQPDVVHTHRSKENVLGSLANRFAGNVPSLRTAHGANERTAQGPKARLRHGLIHALDRWCGRHLQQRVIAVSRELATGLAADFTSQKVVVIENGVDVEAVAAQARTPGAGFRQVQPDAFHLGIVGRLVPVKRVDLFLRTAALLMQGHPARQWRFHVLGDGPLQAGLRNLAAELGIAPVVEFHGHRRDILSCMAELDALLLCSDHEGMPMTVLEAAILEVPIVAHAVGGIPDVVPESLLVFTHTPEAYRDALVRLLGADARGLARQMASRVRQDFSSARNATRIATLYRQLEAQRAPVPESK